MKISIVTVCYNSEKTIKKSIESVLCQNYADLEYIIIDGGSSDSTLAILSEYADCNFKVISELDDGIYDAMNKGFNQVTGDVVAFLNSDDHYSNNRVIESVMEKFETELVDFIYGNIEFVNQDGIITRRWNVGEIKDGILRSQQIPHPAFFCRSDAIRRLNIPFDDKLKICGDLKQQLYLLNKYKIQGIYIDQVLVTMKLGGASTSGLRASLLGWIEAVRVYNEVEGQGGLLYVFRKVLGKVRGLFVI
jgi:glycosyltransferase involved in cell wall biosynthesis|tara:strand:- start:2227 stop:2970 length:744 start_codon:yes stop_codon:yes gene_type:complete